MISKYWSYSWRFQQAPALCSIRESTPGAIMRCRFIIAEGKTSGQRPRATAAAPGRAGKAVLAGSDEPGIQKLWGDVPQEQRFSILDLQAQHLVEVAVVDLSLPANTQSRAAHQTINRRGVEAIYQKRHVFFGLALTVKVLGETRDGLVGYGEKPI